MAEYFKPLATAPFALHTRPAFQLAGGPRWFSEVEHIQRGGQRALVAAADLPADVLARLTAPRADICGVSLSQPSVMGILNATPDSFSDGGLHEGTELAAVKAMVGAGADIIDIGGESTRPGAAYIEPEVEAARVLPTIKGMVKAGIGPVSIDTRKAPVAAAAFKAGASLFNDVTALGFDKDSLETAVRYGVSVCLMHSAGTPETMQDNPNYDNALLDVYDYLHARIEACAQAGIPRSRILVDPGIGFGKTVAHNLALIRDIGIFHALGCGILLGVSRKSLIGALASVPEPERRFAGSMALALEGLNQGVQMLRVHDIAETRQAIALWSALNIED